jgi:hypothetical protein
MIMHVDGKNASNPEQYLNAKSINTMETEDYIYNWWVFL